MKRGLTSNNAEELLATHGLNTLVEQDRKQTFAIFISQFNNFLTVLLLIGVGISFFIGHFFDGTLIAVIVFLNALFGVYQEKKASAAIAALKDLTVSTVRVFRDGKEVEIDSKYIVPGDVVFLEEGTKVPADGVISQAVILEVNESALTGESVPVTKNNGDTVYMGSIIAKGRAHMEVIETGMRTKFGSIASSLSSMEDTQTPLQKKLTQLSRIVGFIGIIVAAIVYAIAQGQGYEQVSSFLLAVSLAVALAPEALPAVMTVTLSVGTHAMARKKAIMRKLSAIEALGSITLIATDKTGTLTTNKMTVREIFVDNVVHDEDHLPTLKNESFKKLLFNGILCSTASLVYVHKKGEHDTLGDPTEASMLYLGLQLGQDYEVIRREWERVDEEPFDNVTKRMSVTVKNGEKQMKYLKGSLDSIISISNHVLTHEKKEKLDTQWKKRIEKVAEEWGRSGLRIMAFAEGETFLGMVGIYDPPRPEVKGAIEKARRAGIQVVMITGDNEKTAEAIGRKIGLLQEGDEIITGAQVEEYSDQELLQKLPNVRIFAKTNPFQKSRITKLYQQLGEIVAVTGDGVNDAIALKQADVGVAMGKTGTDVAREAADMVVTDDNFATIIVAVEEGRAIMRSLKNTIKYLLASNISEAISLTVGLLMGIPNLFYPVQLLYVNLIGDGAPALALAFSPREERVMERPPEKKQKLLGGFDITYIVLVSVASAAIILSSYFYFIQFGEGAARTAAFSVLVMIQTFIFVDLWLSHRSVYKHVLRYASLLFVAVFCFPLALQFVITQVPVAAGLFKIDTVTPWQFLQFVGISSTIVLVVSMVKTVLRYKD